MDELIHNLATDELHEMKTMHLNAIHSHCFDQDEIEDMADELELIERELAGRF